MTKSLDSGEIMLRETGILGSINLEKLRDKLLGSWGSPSVLRLEGSSFFILLGVFMQCVFAISMWTRSAAA